jgi:hypothetical protein
MKTHLSFRTRLAISSGISSAPKQIWRRASLVRSGRQVRISTDRDTETDAATAEERPSINFISQSDRFLEEIFLDFQRSLK